MALSDTAIRAAKPADRPYKLADSGGLFLQVTPNGSRLWRLKYRFEGHEKLLALGAYPAVTLAKARDRRDEAKVLLADGVDPLRHKREAKREAEKSASSTFRIIAEELVEKLRREGRAEITLAKKAWLLDFAYGAIGDRAITDISAADVLDILRRVEARGNHETATRLRSTIGAVFRYAIATARAENDPTFALRGALTTPKVTHRAAITNEKAFGGLLRAIEGFEGQPTTKAALQLMTLLFPRPGELRQAEWSEFDLDKAIWTIPASRTKMRRPHRMPLSIQALSILRDLHALTGRGRLVFPCIRTVLRPISENTLNAALRRLGYGKDEATSHGFRATASTLLNECGLWNPDAIERQLAHVENNDVRRAYARGEHWEERARMMQWWADHIDQLRLGGEIVAFPSRRA
jgi:integrase